MINKYRAVSEEIFNIVSSEEIDHIKLKERLKERQFIINLSLIHI